MVIDLPRSWRILGRDDLQLIETSAGAVLDLSDADIEEGANVVLVAANSTPSSTYASVRVTSYSPPSATPAEIEALSAMVGASSKTNDDLAEFNQALVPTLKKGLEIQKIPLLEFYGVRMERVGGYPAFVSEYRRSGPKGDVYVQLNQIFTPQGDVEVTLAYRGIEKAIWMPVLGRVRSSVTVERAK